MATTITYKGSDLTSFSNTSKTLRTAGKYLEGDITITAGVDVNNQNKTVVPSETTQTVTADTGYTGLSTVTVNGITNTYVGSSVPRKSGTDITTSFVTQGANTYYAINIPSGYYEAGGVNNQPTRSTTVIPSETSITVSSASNNILKDVTVAAITSTYVGSSVPTGEMLVNGPTVTATAGYYATALTETIDDAELNGNIVFSKQPVSIAVNNAGLITATSDLVRDNMIINQAGGYIGYHTQEEYIISNGSTTYQLPTQAATTVIPSETTTTVTGQKYMTGDITVAAITNTYVGSMVTRLMSHTYTPSATTQTIETGQYISGTQIIEPIPSQYIVPSGTLTITSVDTTTTFDATSYASVAINLKNADVTAY